ncbi:hypothetical protein PYK79_55875, partial [Streptomyces sp. ID05-04B]|uniref:hypothetical protein n=1 Tax=Streptomyces sp. ID05-04B TaxID=3028661 RepID=UPI0029C24AB2
MCADSPTRSGSGCSTHPPGGGIVGCPGGVGVELSRKTISEPPNKEETWYAAFGLKKKRRDIYNEKIGQLKTRDAVK